MARIRSNRARKPIDHVDVVFHRLNLGCSLVRGCAGGWYIERDGIKFGRVIGITADDAIASGKLMRTDDRSTVCGETWDAIR
jgi:hypothetical protein